jgi:hypothetical protein
MSTEPVSPQEGVNQPELAKARGGIAGSLRKTSELSTTDLYQRRKRNLFLFGSVVTLITFTRPGEEIPVPLLNGEVTLPVELAFLACLLTTIYFAWEFYGDWETARRRNAELVEAEAKDAEGLGSALERLISVTSYRFGITAIQMESAIKSIEAGEYGRSLEDSELKLALSRSNASLSHLANEIPRWRRASDLLRSSFTQLHESVSKLQKTNFYIDLVLATALTTASVGASGYVVLTSLSLH